MFLHIPKSAGSTTQSIFKKQYKKDALFIPSNNPDLDEVAREIAQNENIKLCFGHIDFGLHEASNVGCKYVTMLRDPVERIISHYYYVKRQPNHYLHDEAFRKNDLSLEEYVRCGLSTELNNGQVRVVVGAGGFHRNLYTKYDVPYGACAPWMLEEAKANIDQHFIFCGIQDRFDESLILMSRHLNWKKGIGYASKNVTHGRKTTLDISDSVIEEIKKYNYLDIQLYEWVKDKVLSKIEEENAFVAEQLGKLNRQKRIESYKHELSQKVKHGVKKVIRFGR